MLSLIYDFSSAFLLMIFQYFLYRNSHRYLVRSFGSNIITGVWMWAIEIFARKRPHNEHTLWENDKFPLASVVRNILCALDFIFNAELNIWVYFWFVGYHPFNGHRTVHWTSNWVKFFALVQNIFTDECALEIDIHSWEWNLSSPLDRFNPIILTFEQSKLSFSMICLDLIFCLNHFI